MRMPQKRGGGGLLGGRFMIIIIGLVGLFIYWQMNQTEVPFSGRKQLNTMSLQDEVKLGQQSYVQILSQEQEQGNQVLCASEGGCQGAELALTQDVRAIGQRLQAAAIELEAELEAQGYAFTPVADQLSWTPRRRMRSACRAAMWRSIPAFSTLQAMATGR